MQIKVKLTDFVLRQLHAMRKDKTPSEYVCSLLHMATNVWDCPLGSRRRYGTVTREVYLTLKPQAQARLDAFCGERGDGWRSPANVIAYLVNLHWTIGAPGTPAPQPEPADPPKPSPTNPLTGDVLTASERRPIRP